jgi:hypothetical protein
MPRPKSQEAPQPIRLSRNAALGACDFGITPPSSIELDEVQVRVRAYERFVERDGRDGSAEVDWLEAERELRERRWNGLG